MLVDSVMPQYTRLSSLLPTATAHPSVAPIVSASLGDLNLCSFGNFCFRISSQCPAFQVESFAVIQYFSQNGLLLTIIFLKPSVIPDLPIYQKIGQFGLVTLWVVFFIMLLSTLTFISMAWRVPVVRIHLSDCHILAILTISRKNVYFTSL